MNLSLNRFDIDTVAGLCKHIREVSDKLILGGCDRIIFTNGCFDLLHKGHLSILRKCRSLAGPKGIVVVGVNSDASVKRLKGDKRPIISDVDRCMLLASMRYVDFAVIFDEDTPYNLIKELRPDVIVKGKEYDSNKVVGFDISAIHLVDMEKCSTTDIIKKISER